MSASCKPKMVLRSRQFIAISIALLSSAVLAFSWPDSPTSEVTSSFDYSALLDWNDTEAKSLLGALHSFANSKPSSLSHFLHRWRVLIVAPEYRDVLDSEITAVFAQDQDTDSIQQGGGSFIVKTIYGPSVRQFTPMDRDAGLPYESHVDQFLATCAEIGIPVERSMGTARGATRIEDLLETSRKRFVLGQRTEWSAVAYALYRPHQPEWINRFGDRCSYNDIIHYLVEDSPDEGPCFGTHRPYSVAVLLAADRRFGMLDAKARREAEGYLRRISSFLEDTQLSCGGWDATWAATSGLSSLKDGAPPSDVRQMMLVTGHHLEWINIVDKQLQPKAQSTARAMSFLLLALSADVNDGTATQNDYCAKSHCCRVVSQVLAQMGDDTASISTSTLGREASSQNFRIYE